MIRQSDISVAMAAADKPTMVETAAQLQAAIKCWLNCDVLGIDTEFVRERTYRADLGLVQFSDGKQVWLLDPLKTGPIDSLAALFENRDVVKILHAPPEDLDVLLHTTGSCPQPLFDSQTACAMLGQDLQMGYHKTVEWLLDIHIDKGETRSNWLKRPLREAQLHYAALDVCLLPMMYRELRQRLQELDREHWLDEDCKRMIDKANTVIDPAMVWTRIGGNNRLNPKSLAILQQLAEWREKEADRRNLARGFVLKDAALMSIANSKPADKSDLSALDVLHPRVLDRYAKPLLGIVAEVLNSGTQAEPVRSLGPEHRKLMADMRDLVKEKALQLDVGPALLASRRELEKLILTDAGEAPPERFMGWRKDIISDDLLALLERAS